MKKKICTLLLLGSCVLSISACGNKATPNATSNVQASSPIEETPVSRDTEEGKDNTGDMAEKQIEVEELNEVVSTDVENEDDNTNEVLVDGMRPEFKEAMDSYEAFYDEYCEIIKKYTENPSDMKLLADYTDMVSKAAEMAEKFEAWESSDMNNAELKYYLDVNNRVTKKLLEVAE